jgi:hypothetical protein
LETYHPRTDVLGSPAFDQNALASTSNAALIGNISPQD